MPNLMTLPNGRTLTTRMDLPLPGGNDHVPSLPGWYIRRDGRWVPTDALTYRTWWNTVAIL